MADSTQVLFRNLGTYLRRLPILTRVVAALIIVFYILGLFGVPMLDYFALDLFRMDFGQSTHPLLSPPWIPLFLFLWEVGANRDTRALVVHRLNTYPLVHMSLVHALLNLFALTPLLERFEREVGTLKATLLILGRTHCSLF